MSPDPAAGATFDAEAPPAEWQAEPRISVLSMLNTGARPSAWQRAVAAIADRLLGLRRLQHVYDEVGQRGLSPTEFAAAAIKVLDLTIERGPTMLAQSLPRTGPVILCANHPFGALEALCLADAIRGVRTDVKFLANGALSVFQELRPALIATNPLEIKPCNATSIRRCEAHLQDGGLLVLFPAGRVSYQATHNGPTVDAEWNRLLGHLARHSCAALVPAYFFGTNSNAFHRLSRWAPRLRQLALPRELLRKRGGRVSFAVGHPLLPDDWRGAGAAEITALARLATYRLGRRPQATQPAREAAWEPVAGPEDRDALAAELATLPAEQVLLDYRSFRVFHMRAAQAPTMMREIARERERTFRLLEEGSGALRDADRFDDSYVQLVAWDQATRSVVGAYRLGRTDELLRERGASGLYLAQMFRFSRGFHQQGGAALELGRSFVVPEHQKSFHGLYLLWQGIGRYLVAHPHYRRLYGTVSLTRLFAAEAVAMLCDVLVNATNDVEPRHPLETPLPPEWQQCRYAFDPGNLESLARLFRATGAHGAELPVLLRHYHRLGAKYNAVGVDPNFLSTPGLLLSIDVASIAPRTLEAFLGSGARLYIANGNAGRT